MSMMSTVGNFLPKKAATGAGVVVAGQWVAVGQGGNTIAYSSDGINWTGKYLTTFDSLGYSVAYGQNNLGNELWVAVGSGTGNNIANSTDGITWKGLGKSYNYLSVAYGKNNLGGNLWVANTNGNVISISSDGNTWTGYVTTAFSFAYNIAYGKDGSGVGIWVAGSYGGNCIATSINGSTWTGRGNTVFFNTRGVAYGKDGSGVGLWVAVGSDGGTGTGNSIAYSYNGITWVGLRNTIFGNTGTGYNVAYGKDSSEVGLWVAVGDDGTSSNTGNGIAYSYNGINWIGIKKSIFNQTSTGVAYGKNNLGTGLWIIGGFDFVNSTYANTMAYSYDGINWLNNINKIFSVRCRGIAFNTPLGV